MGGNASQLTEKDYQKMFQKLNVSHTETLSYSDLCNAKNVPEKLQKYYDYIYVDYFHCSADTAGEITFDKFVELCKQKDKEDQDIANGIQRTSNSLE